MKTLKEVLKIEPYPYQVEGISAALRHNYIIIGDEMGLGKSVQAIAVSALEGLKTLVIVPAFLKLNWINEFNKFCKDKKRIIIVTSSTDTRRLKDYDVAIISYSMLKVAGSLFNWASIVIADEAHYLKNMKAKRTIFFYNLLNDCPPERLIMLTGTPIDKHVIEFYSLLYFCSFNILRNSGIDVTELFRTQYAFNKHFSRAFERKFKINGRTIRTTEWKGLRNLEDLRKLLKGKLIRRKAKNVLDLPELVFKEVVLSNSIEGDKDLDAELDKFLKGKTIDPSKKSHSAYIKSKFTVKYVRELMEENIDSSLVIFTDHILPIQELYKGLNDKYTCKVITGSVTVDKRNEIVNDLQEGKIKILICTIGSGSVGFNMTIANHIVFNDRSWKWSNNDQAIKRIHRIGQKNNCIIHNLICGKVDKRLNSLLKEKQENISHIL